MTDEQIRELYMSKNTGQRYTYMSHSVEISKKAHVHCFSDFVMCNPHTMKNGNDYLKSIVRILSHVCSLNNFYMLIVIVSTSKLYSI